MAEQAGNTGGGSTNPLVGGIAFSVTADTSQLKPGLKDAEAAVKQTADKMTVESARVQAAVEKAATATSAAVTAATAKMAKDTVQAATTATRAARVAGEEAALSARVAASTAATAQVRSFTVGLRAAGRFLSQTMSAVFLAPAIVSQFFEYGQTIGKSIFGGAREEMKKLTDETRQIIAEARTALLRDIRDAERQAGRPQTSESLFADAKKNLDAITENVANLRKEIREVEAQGRRMADQLKVTVQQTQEYYDLEFNIKQNTAARLLLNEKLEKQLKRQAEAQRQVNEIIERGKDAIEEQRNLVRAQRDEERRLAAQREVAAERQAASINRLAALINATLHQRFPPIRGGAMLRGIGTVR